MKLAKLKPALAASVMALGCIGLAACQPSPEQDRAAIERDILSTPGSEGLWGVIKREYPEDFAILIDRVQALSTADRLDQSKGEEIGKVWLREFFDRIAADSVKAPAEQMLEWSTVEAELYMTLQSTAVEECAKMTMGEWIYIENNNTLANRAIAKRNIAMVRAAAAGRDNPQAYAEPADAQFIALGDAIAGTGLSPELQASLGSDAAMVALSPPEQCEIGVAVYRGLTALPDEDEPQMAAYMLAPIPE